MATVSPPTPGDLPATNGVRYLRRVIRITGEDSPNVRLARAEAAAGKRPSGRQLVPGVLPWTEYQLRRQLWDKVRQCIGLDARFYEGGEVLLYPPLWLNRANLIAVRLRGKQRRALGIGIDPAEGGDRTTMAAVDELGLIELVGKRTPDTSVIVKEAIAFMRKWAVPPEYVCIDRGGGGKQHADTMRGMGYPINTVAFGEGLNPDIKRSPQQFKERLNTREDRYAYVNRRAEMYGALRQALDPARAEVEGDVGVNGSIYPFKQGFALPCHEPIYTELHQQLSVMPLLYDQEGRLRMLPKSKRSERSTEPTLIDLIGHSPDEADAVVLALHAMLRRRSRGKVSAA